MRPVDSIDILIAVVTNENKRRCQKEKEWTGTSLARTMQDTLDSATDSKLLFRQQGDK